jgi:hypothetical protein
VTVPEATKDMPYRPVSQELLSCEIQSTTGGDYPYIIIQKFKTLTTSRVFALPYVSLLFFSGGFRTFFSKIS